MNRLQEALNAAEALYGFCGWLTSRKERTVMSSHDEAGHIAELVDDYSQAQGFEKPRPGWEKELVSMKRLEKNIKLAEDLLDRDNMRVGPKVLIAVDPDEFADEVKAWDATPILQGGKIIQLKDGDMFFRDNVNRDVWVGADGRLDSHEVARLQRTIKNVSRALKKPYVRPGYED